MTEYNKVHPLEDMGETLQAIKLQQERRKSSHLWVFALEIGLEYQPGKWIYSTELWDKLQQWYLQNGYLRLLEGGKKIWAEPSDLPPEDKLVKTRY